MCSDLIIYTPISTPTTSASKEVYFVALPKWYLRTLDGVDLPLLYITTTAPTLLSIHDLSVKIFISGMLSALLQMEASLSWAISVVKRMLAYDGGHVLDVISSSLFRFISGKCSSRLWSGVQCFFI